MIEALADRALGLDPAQQLYPRVRRTPLSAAGLTNAATDSRFTDVALRFAQCSYLARLQLS
jgi:hypothetical protein